MSANPTTHPLTSSPPRLNILDGLRGFAALSVVFNHFTVAFYPASISGDQATAHLPGTWEADFAGSPFHALLNFRLCLLFVLSGFVLAASVGKAGRGGRILLAQLARRYVRLGVPVAVGTAVAYGLLCGHLYYNQQLAVVTDAAWFSHFWNWVPNVRQFLADAVVGVLIRGETGYNPVMWTMGVEWYGSVLVLTLLALVGGWRWRLLVYAALALGITLGRINFYYVSFLLGMSLHDLYRRDWAARLPVRGRRALVLGLLVAAVVAASHPQAFYHGPATTTQYAWMRLPGISPDRTVQFYHTLGATALLAATVLSVRVGRFVMWKPLRKACARAFALYITHFLVLGSYSAWLFLQLHARFSYHASYGLMLLLSLPLVVVSAEVFYRWVDAPSHQLARRVGRLLMRNEE